MRRGLRRNLHRSGGAPWSPLTDAAVLEWWDPTTLSDGAVASWVGRKLSSNLAQGTGAAKPTKGATSFNNTPGVSFDGGDQLALAAATLATAIDALTSVRIVAALTDTVTGGTVLYEYGESFSVGGFTCITNDPSAGRLEAGSRDASGAGLAHAAESLATPKVVSLGHDMTKTNGLAFLRSNGVALSLTTSSAGCGGATFAAVNLYLGARTGIANPWTGVVGDFMVLSGNAEDSTLQAAERFIAARAGITL